MRADSAEWFVLTRIPERPQQDQQIIDGNDAIAVAVS